MKRRAITLTELTVGIAILSILAGVSTLSANLWSHTAQREAERLAAKLTALTRKADRTRINFTLDIDRGRPYMGITWQPKGKKEYTERFPISTGCSYEWNANGNKLTYSHTDNTFTGGATIKVEGKGKPYHVIIAVTGGRIRVSDTHPQDMAHTY